MKTLVILVFLFILTVYSFSQSAYDFRSSNWGDDMLTVATVEGSDFRHIDGFNCEIEGQEQKFISLKDEGYFINEYNRNMLNEKTYIYYVFVNNRLVSALYSLDYQIETQSRLISALEDKYGSSLLKTTIDHGNVKKISSSFKVIHPLALVDDYSAYAKGRKSLIGLLEDTGLSQKENGKIGDTPVFFIFKNPFTTIFIISGIIANNIVVYYVERKDNF